MYTGTFIQDLTAAVERVELFNEFRIRQQRMAEEEELRQMLAMQAAQEIQAGQVYAGAA
jgi:hypothetical protein